MRRRVGTALVVAGLASALWTPAGTAATAACPVPAGVAATGLRPAGVEPGRDRVQVPGAPVALRADLPPPVPLADGTELSAFAVEVTATRRGTRVLRRAGQGVVASWTPPGTGRYDLRLAALYRTTQGGICEAAAVRRVDVLRRVVSRDVLLRRIRSMLIRVQKGAQRLDLRAAARTLDTRLGLLAGLRLRSRAGTRALDLWIVATRRYQHEIERFADRFDAGRLGDPDVARIEAETIRWGAASERFAERLRRAGR